MYGDNGWYAFTPQPYAENALELYLLSMREDDAKRAGNSAWLDYLGGKNPDFPQRALQADLARVRSRVAAMRRDDTTPDTRLADDPMAFNPASINSLMELAMGSVPQGRGGNSVVARLRYFDADKRRPGLPADVAALVEKLTADEAVVTLVNVNQLDARSLIVQGGAYGEHAIVAAEGSGFGVQGSGRYVTVKLAPGAGAKVTLRMKRHVNQPTFDLPWD
jgi:hypothetical protein